jgi:hypothetical protein
MPYKRGAMLAHRSVVYARKGYEKKCVDCHYDLVHSERGLVMFRQTRKSPTRPKGSNNCSFFDFGFSTVSDFNH